MTTLRLVAFHRDGGDGGGGIHIYNSMAELKAGSFTPDKWTSEAECERKFQAVMDQEDPYENGEIFNVTMKLEVGPDGAIRLSESAYLHYGQ